MGVSDNQPKNTDMGLFSWCAGGNAAERHFMFVFADESLQHSYDLFREKETCRAAAAVVMFLQTLIQIVFIFSTSQNDFIALRITRLFFLFPGYLLLYALYRRAASQDPFYISWGLTIPRLSNIYLFLASVTFAIMFVMRCLAESCESLSTFHTLGCNPYREVNSIPADSAVGLIISVFAVQMILCTCYWRVIFLCWTFNFVCLIAMIAITRATLSVLFPVLYILVFCASWAYERNVMQRFLALRHIEQLIRKSLHDENEQRVMEMRTVEMRHLLGNVAHDLKTPMQSFVMDIELVDKMLKRPISQTADTVTYSLTQRDAVCEAIQNFCDTTAFMQMIINRSIDYTISSSRYALTPQMVSVNITDVMEWTLKLVRPRSAVPVIFEPLRHTINPNIITDKQWLIENILCLVSNAAKFTSEGCVTVRCDLVEDESEKTKFIHIEVEDTGIGIPKSAQSHIFQPFQQAARMAGGTGLGLYSLHNRVDALHGSCGISDRPDGASGACIWFRIPYHSDESVTSSPRLDPAVIQSLRSMSSSSLSEQECKVETDVAGVDLIHVESPKVPPTMRVEDKRVIEDSKVNVKEEARQKTVLLVDDAMIVRKSVMKSLGSEGILVEVAENGEIGLNKMKSKSYDLVLMDLQMPVMDGFEATRLFREYEAEKGVSVPQKIIGISAFSESEYRTSALACGMNDFISKPFTAKAFLAKCVDDGLL